MRCEMSKQLPLIVKQKTTRYGIHPLFFLQGTRKVEVRHTNFHFSSKKVTSKSRELEDFDLITVDFSTLCLSRKVEIGK